MRSTPNMRRAAITAMVVGAMVHSPLAGTALAADRPAAPVSGSVEDLLFSLYLTKLMCYLSGGTSENPYAC